MASAFVRACKFKYAATLRKGPPGHRGKRLFDRESGGHRRDIPGTTRMSVLFPPGRGELRVFCRIDLQVDMSHRPMKRTRHQVSWHTATKSACPIPYQAAACSHTGAVCVSMGSITAQRCRVLRSAIAASVAIPPRGQCTLNMVRRGDVWRSLNRVPLTWADTVIDAILLFYTSYRDNMGPRTLSICTGRNSLSSKRDLCCLKY